MRTTAWAARWIAADAWGTSLNIGRSALDERPAHPRTGATRAASGTTKARTHHERREELTRVTPFFIPSGRQRNANAGVEERASPPASWDVSRTTRASVRSVGPGLGRRSGLRTRRRRAADVSASVLSADEKCGRND